MRVKYEVLKEHDKIFIWGTGRIAMQYYDKLDPNLNIVGFCDTYSYKWCVDFKDGYPCIDKNDLTLENAVFIAIEDMESIKLVSEELDGKGIAYCHIFEAAKAYIYEADAKILEKSLLRNRKSENKITKYIDTLVPLNVCNLQCNYCYVRQHGDFKNNELLMHSPKFIRAALSRWRLGGSALINFCGNGETMLCKELPSVISELIAEGHYISIVTNGTITKAFDSLIQENVDFSKLFLKFSFHYLELKKKGLLEIFAENVNRMWDLGCSVSIELVPSDEIISLIPEIKEFSERNFGALPHCTVPRNDNKQNLEVLTNLSLQQFDDTWKCFNSAMFKYKMETINQKRFENCMAGVFAFHFNLETGEAYKCIGGNPYLDNLYEDLNRSIHYEKVGNKCCLPYCYNCHAYLALGLVEEVEAPSYYEVRDRVTTDGRHWISEGMREVFVQKLYANNRGDCTDD